MTYTQKAQVYIQQVLSGQIPACQQIIKACQRTANDFARLQDKDFPYFYHQAQAERVCKILEALPHVKGKWAARGEKVKLEPWQCWIVCSLYGWIRKDTKKRKHRRATLIIPRKQGKSFLAAGLLVYHLLFDGEAGAECYCGASNLKQSKEVFSAAQEMLRKSPELCEEAGVEVNASSIIVAETNSKAEPVPGKPKDGANVSFAVCDETHQMPNLALYESFQTGTGAREQPLLISVSTAGFGTENPCRQLQIEAEKVLNGTTEDEELFAAIWTIDPGIDWKSDLALVMANPNVGVSVTLDYLRSQRQGAINNPSKYASFATKHLDLTVAVANGFYSLDKWNKCKDDISLDSFAGEPCWIGVDLASKLDLTAIAIVFRKIIDGNMHFYGFCECFAPSEAVMENPIYTQWAAKELLTVTEGNTISYDDLESLVLSFSEQFKIQEVAYDPKEAEFFVQTIQKKTKFTPVEIPQIAAHLNAPMKFLQELTFNGRIHHDADPVLTFGVSNVIPKKFGNLIQPDKEKHEQKIDPAVALMMAVHRASIAPITPTGPRKLPMPLFA